MKSKGVKGVSTIVSTVIIILLSIIGVSFIMLITFTVIREGSDKIDLNTLTLDLEIKRAVVLNDSFIEVQVKRNSGEEELAGLVFVFLDGYESEILKKEIILDELQEKSFYLGLTKFNTSEVQKISLAPLLKLKSGEIITLKIEDEFYFN